MQARSTIDRRLLEDAARLGVDRHPSVGSLVSGLRHRVPFDAFAVTGLPYADKGIGTGTFLADDWSKSARLEMAQRRWYKRSPVVYALRGGMTRYTSAIEDEIVLQRPELGPAGREMREALGREVAAFPVRLLGKVAGSVTFRRRSGLFDPDELDLLEMVAPALHAAAAAVPDALGRIALTPREREAIAWVSVGKTSGEIADIMGITERTANAHITLATRKLGAASRSHAACEALRRGYID